MRSAASYCENSTPIGLRTRRLMSNPCKKSTLLESFTRGGTRKFPRRGGYTSCAQTWGAGSFWRAMMRWMARIWIQPRREEMVVTRVVITCAGLSPRRKPRHPGEGCCGQTGVRSENVVRFGGRTRLVDIWCVSGGKLEEAVKEMLGGLAATRTYLIADGKLYIDWKRKNWKLGRRWKLGFR